MAETKIESKRESNKSDSAKVGLAIFPVSGSSKGQIDKYSRNEEVAKEQRFSNLTLPPADSATISQGPIADYLSQYRYAEANAAIHIAKLEATMAQVASDNELTADKSQLERD